MKVRQYNMAADAFEWRVMTREQLIGETAMQALANLYGQIAWTCPPDMKLKPSAFIRRAMRDGLADAEVWEVQSLWGCNHYPELRDDDDRPLNPAEEEDDAVAVSRFLVTPLRAEIEASMEAVARDLPWMKEGA